MDRYNHDLGGGDDTDETDDSPLFGSFSSYSPQYRKQNSSKFLATGDCVTTAITTATTITMTPVIPAISAATAAGSSSSLAIDSIKLTRPELRTLDVSRNDGWLYTLILYATCCVTNQMNLCHVIVSGYICCFINFSFYKIIQNCLE